MTVFTSIWLLRLAAATVMIAFGVHQFLNPERWIMKYMPEWLRRFTPIGTDSTMRLHAALNVLIGLYLLSGITPVIGAWIALVSRLLILPFAFYGSREAGTRDLSICLSLLSLVVLSSLAF